MQIHQVEPGWAKRWTLVSWDLFSRNPSWFLLLGGGSFLLFLLSFSFPGLPYPESASIDVLLFLSARAADIADGKGFFAVLASLWKDVWRDTLYLLRDLFLILFLAGIFFALFFYLIHSALQSLGVSGLIGHHAAPGISPVLLSALQQSVTLMTISWAIPGGIALVWLTLSSGYNLLLNFYLGILVASMNRGPTIFFLSLMILFSGVQAAVSSLSENLYGVLALVFLSLLNVFLGLFAYAYCREVFDGEKRNRPVRKESRVTNLATGGAA
ncbi:hypothetical protein AB4090_04755 [Acidithiobacillus sp. IBUN Pt1247-S3]